MFLRAACLTAFLVPSQAELPTRLDVETITVDLVRNGDFDERAEGSPSAVPWWRTNAAAVGFESVDGDRGLRLRAGEWIEQPLGVPASALATVHLDLAATGQVRLTVRAGGGASTEHVIGEPGEPTRANFARTWLHEQLGEGASPRLVLRLEALEELVLLDVAARADLPAPSVDQLREVCLEELGWCLDLWTERAVSETGTAFPRRLFDVVTGAEITPIPGSHNAWSDVLVRAAAVDPRQRPAADRLIDDVLAYAVHPSTGLPCHCDPETGAPLARPVEVHAALHFLLDLAEGRHGVSRDVQQRAGQAIDRAVATILRTGPRPDGEVAAAYHPADGRPNPDVSDLRDLHVPGVLARWAAWRGVDTPEGAAALDTAREAIATFLYAHAWVGEWADIDPGFDDRYGNYGAQGLWFWRAGGDDRFLQQVTRSGIEHFLPRWEDALRLGGNIAADQVRCWRILIEASELDPGLRSRVTPVLQRAALAHLACQQYDDGAWGDVTFKHFDPRTELEVGDLIGTPQNLLEGLALLHDPRLAADAGMPLEEVRAHFLALLSTTRARYRREFGYLSSRQEAAGVNPCRASLGVALALVTMLENLER